MIINDFFLQNSAVNKSYKTLQNEEGVKRCREIIDEAKSRVDEMVWLVLICFLFLSLWSSVWSLDSTLNFDST